MNRSFSVLLILMSFAMGCTTVRYGRMPGTRPLVESLAPQISTKADVLQALGPPRGYGVASMQGVERRRTIWYYESSEAKGMTVSLAMVLVFFDGEVYDGYMWFSSIGRLQRRGGES